MQTAFTISTETLHYFYKAEDHPECKAQLIAFLREFGTNSSLIELYESFLSRSSKRDYLISRLPDQEE